MSNVLASLIVKIGADIKDYSDGLQAATSQLARTSRTMEDAGQRMTLALTVPLVGVSVAALKVAGDFEQTQIAFTHFLGSAGAAKNMLRDLYSFAATTPFEIRDVTQGAQKLMAMGFQAQEVIPMLRGLGDQLSAVGRTDMMSNVILAFGQMKAKTVATGEEIRQMTESGLIPAVRYLAEGLGKTETEIFSMLEKKAIDSTTAIRLIMAGMAKDTGGMGKEQMQSINAQMSNLKDQITLTLKDIGDTLLPLGKSLVKMGGDIAESVKGMAHTFAELPVPVQTAAFAIAGLLAVLGPVVWGLGAMAGAIRSIMLLWPVMAGGAVAAARGISGLTAAVTPLMPLLVALAGWKLGTDIGAWAYANMPGLKAMGDAMADLIMKIPGLRKLLDSFAPNPEHDELTAQIKRMESALKDHGVTVDKTDLTMEEYATALRKAALAIQPVVAKTDEATDAAKRHAAALKALSEALDAAHKNLSLVQQAQSMGVASGKQLREATEGVKAAFLAANPQFHEWWTKADQSNLAMQKLAQITQRLRDEVTRLHLEAFTKLLTDLYEGNVEIPELARNMQPLNDLMKQMADYAEQAAVALNRETDAFALLGITSSDSLHKQAEAARDAYHTILGSTLSTTRDVNAAWVAMQEKIQADAIASGRIVTEAERAELAQMKADLEGSHKSQENQWKKFSQQVSTIVSDLSKSLVDLLFDGGKSFGQKAIEALKNIGKAFVRVFLEEAAHAVAHFVAVHMAGLLASLSAVLSKIPLIGKALGAIFGGGSSATGAAGGAASAGGGVAGAIGGGTSSAAGAGITGIVGAAAGVVSAISGIFGNFQMAGMNRTLDLIETNTRYTQIALIGPAGVIDRLNTWLVFMPGIHERLIGIREALFDPVAKDIEALGGYRGSAAVAGGGFTLNFYGVTNPRDMAEQIMSTMKAAGVKF